MPPLDADGYILVSLREWFERIDKKVEKLDGHVQEAAQKVSAVAHLDQRVTNVEKDLIAIRRDVDLHIHQTHHDGTGPALARLDEQVERLREALGVANGISTERKWLIGVGLAAFAAFVTMIGVIVTVSQHVVWHS